MTEEGPPFRSLSRAERRERILWAAKRVLLDKGLDEASMDDVAARADPVGADVALHHGRQPLHRHEAAPGRDTGEEGF